MKTIHEVMDSPLRQILGKVEIVYTDPLLDSELSITANQSNRVGSSSQLGDGIEEPGRKYFSLHHNKLDGSFHPVSDISAVGWWGNSLSSGAGTLPQPVILTVEFDTPRALNNLKVIGDVALNTYPTDFVIRVYNSAEALLHTEAVTANTNPKWAKDIPQIQEVKKIVATITKINRAGSVCKVQEFYTAVREIYTNDQIIDMEILEELEYPGAAIEISAVSANELDLELSNRDDRFSQGNPGTAVWQYLKKNRKVRVWLGTEVNTPGQIEWYLMGTFWTINWTVPTSTKVTRVVARDRLEMMRFTDFSTSQVYQNQSLAQLFKIVLTDAGLRDTQYVIDTDLQNIYIPYAWFDRTTHRKALQRIAETALVQVYCDRQDRIIITRGEPTEHVVTALSDATNIVDKEFPLAWSEITNYVEVESIGFKEDPLEEVYVDDIVTAIEPGQIMTISYEYKSVPCVDVQPANISRDAAVNVLEELIFAWGVQVTYHNTGTQTHHVNGVSIMAKPLVPKGKTIHIAKDDILIKDSGKIKTTIAHDFIQNSVYADNLAKRVLSSFKASRQDIDVMSRGNVALLPRDRVVAPGQIAGTNAQYLISRQQIHWDGSLEANIVAKKIE